MNRFLLLCFFLLPLWGFSQTAKTKVYYEESMKVQVKFDDPAMQAQFDKHAPKSRTSHYYLLIGDNESLYSAYKKETDDVQQEVQSLGGGGGTFRMEMRAPESDRKVYTQLADKKRQELRDFMGRQFLIKEELSRPQWKIAGGETKEILGYMCQKAVLADTAQTIEAWFAPQLAASYGPDIWGQLPGLVLEVNVNRGNRVIRATLIEEAPTEVLALEVPKKTKEVSREEYTALVKEKMEEMRSSPGGGNRIIIRN